jgi:hypothetical protein
MRKFQRDLAEQIIAWGVYMALSSLLDQEEWERDLPLITGTRAPYTERGRREFEYRTAPAMSVRLGDSYYSYGRLEPLGTTLGLMVDGLNLMRSPKPDEERAGRVFKSVLAQVHEKTFLRGISDLLNAAESPKNFGTRYLSNFASSWVPNLIRQPLRATQTYIQEMKGLPKDEQQGFLGAQWDQLVANWWPVQNSEFSPKVDLWGRDVKRAPAWNSTLGKILMGTLVPIEVRAIPQDKAQQLDLLLLRYNQRDPKGWWPTIPSPYYREGKESKKMTREQYYRYCKLAGERLLEMLSQDEVWKRLDFENPTEADIKVIEKRKNAARRWAKKQVLPPKPLPE